MYNCKAYKLRDFQDFVKMAGPLLLIFIVIYLTHKINELDTDREVMINSWKNIEIMEKKLKNENILQVVKIPDIVIESSRWI